MRIQFKHGSVAWYGRFVLVPWGCRLERAYYLSWLRLRIVIYRVPGMAADIAKAAAAARLAAAHAEYDAIDAADAARSTSPETSGSPPP